METRTAEDQTYNGWSNYATWGVALVLDNDHGTYLHVRAYIEAFKAEAPTHRNVPDIWTEEEAVRFELADFLKDYTEELCGLGGEPGPTLMASQVLQAGLSEVDWQEIADNLLAD